METIDEKIKRLESELNLTLQSIDDLKALKKISDYLVGKKTDLPPCFEIKWFSRRDPFESCWALYLHGDRIRHGKEEDSEDTQKLKLREEAWRQWENAFKIMRPYLKEEFQIN
jgi:hypothetical protein